MPTQRKKTFRTRKNKPYIWGDARAYARKGEMVLRFGRSEHRCTTSELKKSISEIDFSTTERATRRSEIDIRQSLPTSSAGLTLLRRIVGEATDKMEKNAISQRSAVSMSFLCCIFALAPCVTIWRTTHTTTAQTEMNKDYPALGAEKRYLGFSDFVRPHFSHKVQKITINAGFTCPNRDGAKGVGGCTYCNNQSFNPDYSNNDEPVRTQLERGKSFFRRAQERRAQRKRRLNATADEELKFLAYFQAYTNTYGELEHIKRLYEEALMVDEVVGLVIGTRPDCVSDELLDYFSDLQRQAFVLVEYGVESTYESTLQRINRGHSFACSIDAIRRTHERNIPVGAHTIIGLPGETEDMIIGQVEAINALPLDTLKLHQLQIVRGTIMAYEFIKAKRRERLEPNFHSDFYLFTAEEYARLVVDILERLRPDIVVERFASSSPPELLLAPNWGMKNHEFTALVDKELQRRNTWQGRLYLPPSQQY